MPEPGGAPPEKSVHPSQDQANLLGIITDVGATDNGGRERCVIPPPHGHTRVNREADVGAPCFPSGKGLRDLGATTPSGPSQERAAEIAARTLAHPDAQSVEDLTALLTSAGER
jgi:hypothetical protein